MQLNTPSKKIPLRNDASYSVAALVKEAPEVIWRFVRYYQAKGADHIFLYYDGVRSDLPSLFIKRLAEVSVDVTFCDAAYWTDAVGGTDQPLHEKQSFIYHRAKGLCESEWLFIVDADEYIIAYMDIRDVLGQVPEEVDSVGLPPAEAVWGPKDDLSLAFGSTWFRRPYANPLAWKWSKRFLYGGAHRNFTLNHIGHTSGKHFIRARAVIDTIGCHRSRRGGQSVTVCLSEIFAGRRMLEVAHFDAICFSRWKEKFARRISKETLIPRMRSARKLQVTHISESFNSTTNDAAEQLFRSFYHLSALQVSLLKPFDAVFQLHLFEGMEDILNYDE